MVCNSCKTSCNVLSHSHVINQGLDRILFIRWSESWLGGWLLLFGRVMQKGQSSVYISRGSHLSIRGVRALATVPSFSPVLLLPLLIPCKACHCVLLHCYSKRSYVLLCLHLSIHKVVLSMNAASNSRCVCVCVWRGQH